MIFSQEGCHEFGTSLDYIVKLNFTSTHQSSEYSHSFNKVPQICICLVVQAKIPPTSTNQQELFTPPSLTHLQGLPKSSVSSGTIVTLLNYYKGLRTHQSDPCFDLVHIQAARAFQSPDLMISFAYLKVSVASQCCFGLNSSA